jgi:hypothetical protein
VGTAGRPRRPPERGRGSSGALEGIAGCNRLGPAGRGGYLESTDSELSERDRHRQRGEQLRRYLAESDPDRDNRGAPGCGDWERERAVYIPTDGPIWQRSSGSVWTPFGPVFPFTKPPAVASWTWVNQGSATAVDSNAGVYLQCDAVNTDNYRILVKTAPSTPYTITAAFSAILCGNKDSRISLVCEIAAPGSLSSGASTTTPSTTSSRWRCPPTTARPAVTRMSSSNG